MQLPVYQAGTLNHNETVTLAPEVFEKEFNQPLVHQVLTAYIAGSRQGTKAQKTRAEVRGGGKKPWRQKGTGRARAGSIRSPIWRGGGRALACKPRDYTQKVNRKMYRAAIRSILSELVRNERLMIIDDLKLEHPKTKDLLKILQPMELNHALIITDMLDENLYLSARNIPNLDIIDADMLEPYGLIGFEKIVMTASAVKMVEEQLV